MRGGKYQLRFYGCAEGHSPYINALEGGSSNEIHSSTKDLNRISGVFAARRMNLHIGEALKGESIDEVE